MKVDLFLHGSFKIYKFGIGLKPNSEAFLPNNIYNMVWLLYPNNIPIIKLFKLNYLNYSEDILKR